MFYMMQMTFAWKVIMSSRSRFNSKQGLILSAENLLTLIQSRANQSCTTSVLCLSQLLYNNPLFFNLCLSLMSEIVLSTGLLTTEILEVPYHLILCNVLSRLSVISSNLDENQSNLSQDNFSHKKLKSNSESNFKSNRDKINCILQSTIYFIKFPAPGHLISYLLPSRIDLMPLVNTFQITKIRKTDNQANTCISSYQYDHKNNTIYKSIPSFSIFSATYQTIKNNKNSKIEIDNDNLEVDQKELLNYALRGYKPVGKKV